MMEVKINLLKKPNLKEPFLVSGLPGIGHVAKLSANYLIQELKAELFGEIYSKYFPPYVLIKKDGIVELMKNELYYCKNSSTGKDLIIFTGNTQAASPEGQYIIAEAVLSTAIQFGVRRLYSTAAFVTDRLVKKPKVYGASTEFKLLKEIEKYDVIPMEEGSIGGTNGLLFGLAKTMDLPGVCLLGETRNYKTPLGHSVVDAKAARAVLESLTKMLSIHIDMEPIENQAKLTAEFIDRLEEIERNELSKVIRDSHEERTHYIS